MRRHHQCYRLIADTLALLDAHPDPNVPDQYYIDYDPNAPWPAYPEEGDEYGGYDDPGSAAPGQEQEYWGEDGQGEGDGEGEGEGDGQEGDYGEYAEGDGQGEEEGEFDEDCDAESDGGGYDE
jgi:transcription initiation factor TFIID subunit 7